MEPLLGWVMLLGALTGRVQTVGLDRPGWEEPEVSATDLGRFPGRRQAWKYYEWGQAHQGWLHRQQPGWDRVGCTDDLYRWRDEQGHANRAWDALADAWGYYQEPRWDVQQGHLKRLRRILGKEAYWQGAMPPLCSWWRFEERK